jgi:hypothetical protein
MQVGDKVLCIHKFCDEDSRIQYPQVGDVYTIRTVEFEDNQLWIRLVEMVNARMPFKERFGECQFWSERFIKWDPETEIEKLQEKIEIEL